ncbi:MAG: hypothetical protein IJT73_06985 [Selenomonadaceae bacterium]|nr:hypothetical protein [Selenomonadaceae bacterium]
MNKLESAMKNFVNLIKQDFIQKALKLIEKEMQKAALELPDSVFVEYWGESVPPENRISRWLEIADSLAKNWKPSKCLFLKKITLLSRLRPKDFCRG